MPISVELVRQDAERVRQSQIMRFKDPDLVDAVLRLDKVRDSRSCTCTFLNAQRGTIPLHFT